jgi:uncharacterized protein YggE
MKPLSVSLSVASVLLILCLLSVFLGGFWSKPATADPTPPALAEVSTQEGKVPGWASGEPGQFERLVKKSPDKCPTTDCCGQVTITGTGETSVRPDRAKVCLAVTTTADTADQASATNAKTVAKVSQAMKGLRLTDDMVQTCSFSVAPKYTYPKEGEPKLTGYVAEHVLGVTIDDTSATGTVIEKALAAGANRVSGIQWMLKEKNSLLDQTRHKAFADAKRKAELYAKAGDFSLCGIKSLVESASREFDYAENTRNFPGGDAPSLQPGELTFRVTVQVVYDLKRN